MSKYKIGITETVDAGSDLSWESKLNSVDGAILLAKRITPDFRNAALRNKNKLIIHAVVSGYGSSALDSEIPQAREMFGGIMRLIDDGFPQRKIVIRLDPIIPTEDGLCAALEVLEFFMRMQFSRFRISVLKMYPKIREQFQNAGLPLPYGGNIFASWEQLEEVDEMLLEAKAYWMSLGNRMKDLRIESCSEPYLKEPIPCGCISSYDLALLKLDPSSGDTKGGHRKGCLCYSGKQELLPDKHHYKTRTLVS